MSDFFKRMNQEMGGDAKNRKDSSTPEEIPEPVLDLLMLHICAHGRTKQDRLSARLLINAQHLVKLVNQVSRFAGEKTGKTTVSDLSEANSLIEAAIQVIEEFIDDHPIPEKTIFDKE